MTEELSDEQMEQLYSSFTDPELQKILNQEKSLQKRRIVRKIMRNRSNANEKEPSIIKCDIETCKQQQQQQVSKLIPQMSINVMQSPIMKKETEEKDYDQILRELNEQLRTTTRLDERRELRNKIQKLKELNESKSNNAVHFFSRHDEEDRPENNLMKKSELPRSTFTNEKSSFNVMLPNSATYNHNTDKDNNHNLNNNNNNQIVGREKITLQNISQISITEMGQVEMKVNIPSIKSLNPKIIWYFKNRPIAQYPNWNFNNKQLCQQHNFVSFQFQKASKRLNEGTYRVEIEDGKVTYIGEFELVIGVVSKEATEPHPSNVSSNKDEVQINAATEMEPKSIITSANPTYRANSSTRSHPNTATNSQYIATPKYVLTTPSERPSNHLHHSQTMSTATKPPPSLVNVPKYTDPSPHPVSRVKSMKENFEKSANLNNNSIPSSTRPQMNTNTQPHVIQRPYSYTPTKTLMSPTSPPSQLATTKTSSAVSLDVPSSQGRMPSQTNIITMVPKLLNKVSKARTNIQAYKEQILNFCKSNTEEYQNVNITNFSGSWADGLAFCALIHHFYPNSFNYSKLTSSRPFDNFKLAFDTALQEADIDQLLDPSDMIALSTPDWKCVYTYLQSMYTKLRTHPRNVINEPEKLS